MKKIVFIIAASFLFGIGCKKSSNQEQDYLGEAPVAVKKTVTQHYGFFYARILYRGRAKITM